MNTVSDLCFTEYLYVHAPGDMEGFTTPGEVARGLRDDASLTTMATPRCRQGVPGPASGDRLKGTPNDSSGARVASDRLEGPRFALTRDMEDVRGRRPVFAGGWRDMPIGDAGIVYPIRK